MALSGDKRDQLVFDFAGGDDSAQEGQHKLVFVRDTPTVLREPWGDITRLDQLESEVRLCCACSLREGCNGVVFGEGNPQTRVMLVGEGPGATEDEVGRPFVGKAGQLLDRILEAAGFRRSDVYITNVVKCRPPGNRVPVPEEVAKCMPHLRAQIRVIKPGIIICLGALASQTLIDGKVRITRDRGIWRHKDGVRYMPTFHPAALLRDPSKKRSVWQDFQRVRDAYQEILSSEGTP